MNQYNLANVNHILEVLDTDISDCYKALKALRGDNFEEGIKQDKRRVVQYLSTMLDASESNKQKMLQVQCIMLLEGENSVCIIEE